MQEDELDLHDGVGGDRDEVPDSYKDGNKDIGQAGPLFNFPWNELASSSSGE